MKTVISIPDDLFLQAEAAARRLRISRSELYATAIAQFLERQNEDTVTECLNQIYTQLPAKVEDALHRAQLKTLGIKIR